MTTPFRSMPNFAPAHSQLAQTYLKLGDTSRAFQELNKTVELAPDNYRAHTDLANLAGDGENADGSPDQDASETGENPPRSTPRESPQQP